MFLGIFKYFLVATPLENMCKYPRTHLKLFATDFLLGKQKFHGDNKRCQPRLTFLCNKILLLLPKKAEGLCPECPMTGCPLIAAMGSFWELHG